MPYKEKSYLGDGQKKILDQVCKENVILLFKEEVLD